MRVGIVITIPESVASQRGEKVTIQPGLPGRWSVWSQAAGSPGSHFVVPADEAARQLGIKHATVKIIEPDGEAPRVTLLQTEPARSMPPKRTERQSA